MEAGVAEASGAEARAPHHVGRLRTRAISLDLAEEPPVRERSGPFTGPRCSRFFPLSNPSGSFKVAQCGQSKKRERVRWAYGSVVIHFQLMGLQLGMYTDQHPMRDISRSGWGITHPVGAGDAPSRLYKFILKYNLFIKNSKIFQKM